MSIVFNKNTRIFTLETEHTTYQMQIDSVGSLLHLYYGPRVGKGDDMTYLLQFADRGFSGNVYEKQYDKRYSIDTVPLEYSVFGAGDYRLSALLVRQGNGAQGLELRYDSHRISRRKYSLPGLPSVRQEDHCRTLTIDLTDAASGIRVRLYYGVLEARDVITRAVQIINEGRDAADLEKAASMTLDFPYGNWDLVHFHGRHTMERIPERIPLPRTIVRVGSARGMSSHHHNPFVILCDRNASEDTGLAFGFMPVYSGSHCQEFEVDQAGLTRVVCGLDTEAFGWHLESGESFYTPEIILTCSQEGFNGLSHILHRLLRDNVCPPAFRRKRKPVLINSWEAAYFDFTGDQIVEIGRKAADLGIEMLVMDDGWFADRHDDDRALGDWTVNEDKLGCSLGELSRKIRDLGLSFGLWFEPEMISEKSALAKDHPDWIFREPGRLPNVSRKQLVLDMSRKDVQDYLFTAMEKIIEEGSLSYIKWDFNRALANCFSRALPADRQKEVPHRFMLGTYALLERLEERFPDLMIEGCAGGGGRFDAGMLYYCPQIWCSDDTDALERLEIQRGTSYGYPVSCMGAHLSASPNHQTGRTMPFETRGITAMSGSFGYELDPADLTVEEEEAIRDQIRRYRDWYDLIHYGTYYRLGEIGQEGDQSAWLFVSEDRREALLNLVLTHVRANSSFPFVRLRGLDPQARYRDEKTGRVISGRALMQGGYSLPIMFGDHPAVQIRFVRED